MNNSNITEIQSHSPSPVIVFVVLLSIKESWHEFNSTKILCSTLSWNSYYIDGLAITVICSLAIVGNIICIIVLSRPVMKSSVNLILLTLSCADLTRVVVKLLIGGIPKTLAHNCVGVYYTHWLMPILSPYLHPIGITSQVASVYLTVLVSIERFVAVCKPFRARVLFSWGKSRMFCLGVILFSIFYNLPVWFELYTQKRYSKIDLQFLGLASRRTDLFVDKTYYFYYVNLGSMIIIRLIPFTFLVFLNYFIYQAIVRLNKTRKRITQYQSQEVSVTRMLLCVVLLFLICNILPIIYHMFETTKLPRPKEFGTVCWFLVWFNASFNFVIYCFFSRKFRKVLLRLIGFGTQWDSTNVSSRTQSINESKFIAYVSQVRKSRQGRLGLPQQQQIEAESIQQ